MGKSGGMNRERMDPFGTVESVFGETSVCSAHPSFRVPPFHPTFQALDPLQSPRTKRRLLRPCRGQQFCFREAKLCAAALCAAWALLQVCSGKVCSGGRAPPSVLAPLCRGSAGSFAALGWRRRPTEEENKYLLVLFSTNTKKTFVFIH